MSNTWIIYSLIVEGEQQPFYIGCTSRSSHRRVIEHLHRARVNYGNPAKAAVIQAAEAAGKSILSETLETHADRETAHARETFWIEKLGRIPQGPLTNTAKGGTGGGYSPSEETRSLQSKAKIGNKINLGRIRPDTSERNCKPVTAYTETGEFVKSFNSALEASEFTSVTRSIIGGVCLGKRAAAKSSATGIVYQFRFGNNPEPIKPVVFGKRPSKYNTKKNGDKS